MIDALIDVDGYLTLNCEMKQGSLPLKGAPLLEVVPIERRANCKMVALGNRHFLVGGMTAEAVTNAIYEFRLNNQFEPARLQWKELHFDNNLFSPRNSFAACGAKGLIYVWGGLDLGPNGQQLLSDLIQIDVDKGRMRLVPLKEKIGIHSSSLSYDQERNELLGYSGTNVDSTLPARLYRLNLDQKESYEWESVNVPCLSHQGYIWQHSGTFSTTSFFTGTVGKFLTIVGGCRQPQSPYPSVVEIDLTTGLVRHQTKLDHGLVSHDAVQRKGRLYIFGGSNGGDFNSTIFALQSGTATKLKGHRAIGCSCSCLDQRWLIVYGGVCGATSINGAFIYE